ncbi:MAG TPA: hypothetical protein VFS22_06150 [Flavisolibacter sp.]|nr:hypothetical protein [Flavisolibacter sp.]
MRIIFCFLTMLPFIAKAQINRSASELAQENIKEYINSKIFKGRSYKAVSYGQLKENKVYNMGILWAIDHRFEIGDVPNNSDKVFAAAQQPYRFIFYMDKKMKVVRAEEIKL